MRWLTVVAVAAVLSGCGALDLFRDEKTTTTVPAVPRERSVDPQRAAELINAHRQARGRPPLRVDPRLNAIAARTARELARRNQVKTEMHTTRGLARRLEAANYRAARASENLGGGYPTLVTAVEGWKGSREHNRNLLNREMTHMGIGLAVTDRGKLKSFWVLLLARPDQQV